MKDLARWAALPDIPDLLPGEDRSFGSGLFVDLVPSSCWFTNAPPATHFGRVEGSGLGRVTLRRQAP